MFRNYTRKVQLYREKDPRHVLAFAANLWLFRYDHRLQGCDRTLYINFFYYLMQHTHRLDHDGT